jgi:hypothetical protein
MSDFRAIATVTAVIRDLLQGVKSDIDNVSIKAVPPDTLKSLTEDTLNLYLYQVTPNAAYRNVDLPTRTQDGKTIIAKPQLALDLHYLLTSYAAHNDELKAQLMLASAMTILHDNAVIPRSKIAETVDNQNSNVENDLVKKSNLADQVEAIKLNPQALSLEELTKLWSSFFQASYRISVAYKATVVLLESKLEPKPSLPVSKRLLRVFPIKQPIIDSVEPQILEFDPNAKLTIKGRNLSGDKVFVRLNGSETAISNPRDLSENQILTALPGDLTAGAKKVVVVHKFLFGPDDSGHKAYESNVAAFVLAPKILSMTPQSVKQGETLTINLEPGIALDQKVTVLIGDYVLAVDLPSAESSYPLNTLAVKIPQNVALGSYAVRLRIDGADSLPKDDDSQAVQVTKNP